jgi:hypothetical protein
MSHFRYKWIALIGGATLIASSQATIAFNNFGTDNSFDTSIGWSVLGGTGSIFGEIASACQFQSASSGQLDTILLGLGDSNFDFTPSTVNVSLMTDDSGLLGTTLGTWLVTGLGQPFSTGTNLITNTDPAIHLTAGANYWLLVAPGTGESRAFWYLNNVNDLGQVGQGPIGFINSSHEDRRGVMRIETNSAAVPGPFAAVPFVIGGIGVALNRRRRRNA